MLKLISTTALTCVMAVTALADEPLYIFRAKGGVLPSSSSVPPAPVEPTVPGDDQEVEDDGVFIIQHGATMWPITDVLRPGDRVSYSVALDNSSDATIWWTQWRSIRARLSPVPDGNFLEAIGIPEQAVCQEFSGMNLGPWHAAPCLAIQSRPITQEEICSHPTNRISGTFRFGNIRLEGLEWETQNNSASYDLALDKSGCEQDASFNPQRLGLSMTRFDVEDVSGNGFLSPGDRVHAAVRIENNNGIPISEVQGLQIQAHTNVFQFDLDCQRVDAFASGTCEGSRTLTREDICEWGTNTIWIVGNPIGRLGSEWVIPEGLSNDEHMHYVTADPAICSSQG